HCVMRRLQRVDAGRGGALAEEKAGPRRIAERGLAVGVGKGRPPPREAIEVWRLARWMSTEWSDPVVEIVNGDQQDVGMSGFRGHQRHAEQQTSHRQKSRSHAANSNTAARRSLFLRYRSLD